MCKSFLFELFHLVTDCIMHFPFAYVRFCYAKIVCKHVGKGTQFSRHVHLISPHKISFGNHVFVNRNVTLDGRKCLVIGDNVDIGEYSSVWSLQHDPNNEAHNAVGGGTEIKDHCWIAPHSIILPGVIVNRGTVVATASVVTKDTPEMSIVAGVPARKIKDRHNSCDYILNYKIIF